MNRNVESYFSTVPSAHIQRSSFDRSQNLKFTGYVGDLIPFFWDECLPGDVFNIETSKVVRLQTLLTPVMDNLYMDVYYFFVPNRLVWTHWKDFMGENTQSAWLPEVTYSIPQLQTGHMFDSTTYTIAGFPVGSMEDYLGIPPLVDLSVSALPFRAVQLIYNEWFRDENLQDPINIYFGDTVTTHAFTDEMFEDGADKQLYKVNKYHDYFTSALPAPLKGEPVLAPVSGSAPVVTGSPFDVSGNENLILYNKNNSGSTALRNAGVTTTGGNNVNVLQVTDVNSGYYVPSNLYADSGALGINIMQLRNAFQVQKLLERDARSGTRYTEIIRGHFGVTSPDSRLQRPEYLGGNRIPISIHQITNQSQGEQDFLGDLGAMSLTTDRNDDFNYSATEHGHIIGIVCARYDHSYPQGLERMWSRKTRFDYYWPEFAHLSEMAILNKEIYAQGTSEDDEVFGYQEAWADYRYKPNRVASEMRPGISNSLASWHFADYYEELPKLSEDWIAEDKTNVDRTLAVTSSLANQIFCDVYVKNISTRPMPVRSIPGMADHF